MKIFFMNRKNVGLALILCILLYVVFASLTFHQIITGDEVIQFNGGRTINTEGIPRDLDGSLYFTFNHTPGYLYALALAERLFGKGVHSARLMGMLCFVIGLILVYNISKTVFKGLDNNYLIALAACLLYSINSLAVQGSLLLEFDTATLPVTLLLFILYFLRTPQTLSVKNLTLLSILFTLALWAKLTTPLALILSILFFYFLNREYKKGLYYSGVIFFVGAGIFLASWWLHCHFKKAPFFLPFYCLKYQFETMFLQEGLLHSILTLMRGIWRIMLWVSPFFLILAMLAIVDRVRLFRQKKKLVKIDFLAIYSLLVFVGYLITGRLAYGFPKYHFPVISTLCILTSGYLFYNKIEFNRRVWLILSLSMPLLIIYNVYFIKDLLYTTDYIVKESLITGIPNLKNVLSEGIFKFFLYLLPFPVYLFGLRLLIPRTNLLNKIIVSLLIMIISANLSLNILQAKANYLTRYHYGGKGTEEVIDFLNRHVHPQGLILAPLEIIYFSNNDNIRSYYVLRSALRKRIYQVFIKAISNKKVTCVIYGIHTQSVNGFTKVINRPDVQKVLKNNFQSTKIDSFTVWLRRQ